MPPSRYLVSHPSDYPDIVLYRGTGLRGQVEGHAHEALELEILEAGENRFRYRGQEHRQPPRSLLVIPAGERHEGGAAPGRASTFRKLHIAPALFADLFAELTGRRRLRRSEPPHPALQARPRDRSPPRPPGSAKEATMQARASYSADIAGPRRAHPEVGGPRLEDWLAQRTSVIVG